MTGKMIEPILYVCMHVLTGKIIQPIFPRYPPLLAKPVPRIMVPSPNLCLCLCEYLFVYLDVCMLICSRLHLATPACRDSIPNIDIWFYTQYRHVTLYPTVTVDRVYT